MAIVILHGRFKRKKQVKERRKALLNLKNFLDDVYHRGFLLGYFTSDRPKEIQKIEWLMHSFTELISIPKEYNSEFDNKAKKYD